MDLGIDQSAQSINVEKLELVPERSDAKILDGSVDEQVTELVRILKQEEKVL